VLFEDLSNPFEDVIKAAQTGGFIAKEQSGWERS
jgi:hypothetical protein